MRVKNIPENIRVILDIIEERGFEAYLVGGCVRDSIINELYGSNKEVNDWDIATNMDTEGVRVLFKGKEYGINTVGEKYGTVVVTDGVGEEVEITTYRTDGVYEDSRRPKEVKFARSLKEDVMRRDLTINGLACNKVGEIVDYIGGVEDIKEGKIRFIGDVYSRLNEDLLRAYRAIRFKDVFGFSMDVNVMGKCYRVINEENNVSNERVRGEIDKLFKNVETEEGCIDAIIMATGKCKELNDLMCPQNNVNHVYDVYMHTVKAMSSIDMLCENSRDKVILKWALMLHDLGKKAVRTTGEDGVDHFYEHALMSEILGEKVLRKMKFTSLEMKEILFYIRNHDFGDMKISKVRKMVSMYGYEWMNKLILVSEADKNAQNTEYNMDIKNNVIRNVTKKLEQVKREGSGYRVADLKINGNDLIEMGYKGKEIGDVLNSLLKEVWGSPVLNNREWLLSQCSKRKR